MANKIKETNSAGCYRQFDAETQAIVYDLRLELEYVKKSFQVIINKEQYANLRDIPIGEYLVSIQDKIDPQKVKISYFRDIHLKKKQYKWEKAFIDEWSKSYDNTKKNHQEKVKQKKQEQIKSTKIPPKI